MVPARSLRCLQLNTAAPNFLCQARRCRRAPWECSGAITAQMCLVARASCYIKEICSCLRGNLLGSLGAAISLSSRPYFPTLRPAERRKDASATSPPSRRALRMAEAIPTVIVVDDDPAIRESSGGLLRSVGLQAKLFTSVDEFLTASRPDGPACLVLD